MKFITEKMKYLWFVFTANWARYVILAGLVGFASIFVWGRYGS